MQDRLEVPVLNLPAKFLCDFYAQSKRANIRHHNVFDCLILLNQRGLDTSAQRNHLVRIELHMRLLTKVLRYVVNHYWHSRCPAH